jgi:hypothetical protein
MRRCLLGTRSRRTGYSHRPPHFPVRDVAEDPLLYARRRAPAIRRHSSSSVSAATGWRRAPVPVGGVRAPASVLAEMRRVLVPEGLLGVASSDWSGARVEPFTPHVRRALEAHYALRRRAGGDPFAGGHLPRWVAEAGFGLVRTGAEDRIDMSYPELANYVVARIERPHAVRCAANPAGSRRSPRCAAVRAGPRALKRPRQSPYE